MNTRITHTPGPWRFTDYGIEASIAHAAAQQGVDTTDQYPESKVIITTLNPNHMIRPMEALKNFFLLAAAPELLTALEEAVSRLEYHAPDTFDDKEHELNWIKKMDEWKQLIAKAKGV